MISECLILSNIYSVCQVELISVEARSPLSDTVAVV